MQQGPWWFNFSLISQEISRIILNQKLTTYQYSSNQSQIYLLQTLPSWHLEIKFKALHTLSVKLSEFIVWRHIWLKNWVNCAVLTENCAGLRTVLSIRLSNTELRSSLRESHRLLSLPADNTMVSPRGTSVSSNSCSRWASHDIFLFKYHFFTPHFTLSNLLFG